MYCLHDIALCYCTCMIIVHVNHLMKTSGRAVQYYHLSDSYIVILNKYHDLCY